MAELADAPDSKSGSRKRVGVRPSLRAPPARVPGRTACLRNPCQAKSCGLRDIGYTGGKTRIFHGFEAGEPERWNVFRTGTCQEFLLTQHAKLTYIFACL